jgi:hypothetical protein
MKDASSYVCLHYFPPFQKVNVILGNAQGFPSQPVNMWLDMENINIAT